MTFRIPETGDEVRFFSPVIGGPYRATVRGLATASGELGADLTVTFPSGGQYLIDAVRYRDAAPDPDRPEMFFEFEDDDGDVP